MQETIQVCDYLSKQTGIRWTTVDDEIEVIIDAPMPARLKDAISNAVLSYLNILAEDKSYGTGTIRCVSEQLDLLCDYSIQEEVKRCNELEKILLNAFPSRELEAVFHNKKLLWTALAPLLATLPKDHYRIYLFPSCMTISNKEKSILKSNIKYPIDVYLDALKRLVKDIPQQVVFGNYLLDGLDIIIEVDNKDISICYEPFGFYKTSHYKHVKVYIPLKRVYEQLA